MPNRNGSVADMTRALAEAGILAAYHHVGTPDDVACPLAEHDEGAERGARPRRSSMMKRNEMKRRSMRLPKFRDGWLIMSASAPEELLSAEQGA